MYILRNIKSNHLGSHLPLVKTVFGQMMARRNTSTPETVKTCTVKKKCVQSLTMVVPEFLYKRGLT